MTQTGCEHEEEVISVSRTGNLSLEMTEHIQACCRCREAQLVAMFMISAGADAVANARPPAVQDVWRRAAARRRRAKTRRAFLPLLVMETLTTLCLALAAKPIFHYVWPMDRFQRFGFPDSRIMIGCCFVAALLLAGTCGYMLHASRRDEKPLIST